MTAQITDTLVVEGLEYDIIGVEGDEPFDPSGHELRPVMLHTACYAGYYYTATVIDGRLALTDLVVKQEPPVYPDIAGVVPEVDEMEAAQYHDVRLPLTFSGTVRGARDFLQDRYVHMGFQEASSFETVADFVFEDGRLTEVRDRTDLSARGQTQEDAPSNLEDFIEKRFDRSIDTSEES